MYDGIQVTSTNAVVMETEVGGGERKGKGEKEEGEAGHLKGNGDTVLYI